MGFSSCVGLGLINTRSVANSLVLCAIDQMIVLIITPLWRYSSEREVQLGDLDLLDVSHSAIVDQLIFSLHFS